MKAGRSPATINLVGEREGTLRVCHEQGLILGASLSVPCSPPDALLRQQQADHARSPKRKASEP